MEKEWITVIAYLGFKVHSLRVFCFLHFHHRHYSFLRLASISSILFTVVSHSNLFPQLQRLHVHFFLKLPSIFTLSLLSTTVSFWVLPISPPPPPLTYISISLDVVPVSSVTFSPHISTIFHAARDHYIMLVKSVFLIQSKNGTLNSAARGLTTATQRWVEASPTLLCQQFQTIIPWNWAICALFKSFQWDTAKIVTNYP